ncbi:MAG: sigma-54 dependent transcriptional regulator [Polyangiales bacterium]
MASVLVVDDEEGFRSFLCEVLTDAGHDATGVGDGGAAIAALARARYDLLLTDLNMPGADGEAVLRHARATRPELPVVVITAHGSVERAVDAMKRGATDFIQKPLESPAALRALVTKIVQGRKEIARPRGDEDPPLTWGAPAMTAFVSALQRVARTPATALLLGESGSGKELAARALHRWSARSDGPFAAVNCGALATTVLESELFGHERGAFTGAVAQHQGRLERARGGSFFLDEIGELTAELQVKLLRVLETRSYERVGGTTTLRAEVRWVAATHRDLKGLVQAGNFREDLYHRVAVVPLRVPALRERREDIAPLARHLVAELAGALGLPPPELSPEALATLEGMPWPGNVRQLRNVLERAVILSDDAVLRPADFSAEDDDLSARGASTSPVELRALERDAIVRALQESGGNRRRAAERLGIGLRTLYEKLKRYGL